MKNESEFNNIVVKSLDFGHKIADTRSSVTFQMNKLPFDGFGVFKDINNIGHPVYFESKFLRKPQAFNFSRLEDHQIDALLKCSLLLDNNALILFLICVDFGRADKRVFFFRNMEYLNQRKINKQSITKKEFENLQNYIPIIKQKIDFNKILQYKED